MSKFLRQTIAALMMTAVVSAGAFAQDKGQKLPPKPPVKVIDGKGGSKPPNPPPRPPKDDRGGKKKP